MLGSVVDADDLLQETLLAAWRGLNTFACRSSLRAWLYRIATNRCLNVIRDSKRRRPAEPTPPFDPPQPSRLGEVTWLQPYPDDWLEQAAAQAPGPAERSLAREAVELAFIVALQVLPPRQTAVLLLYDVLGFTTAEVAAMLDASPSAVKGALQRARASVDQHNSTSGHGPGARRDVQQERVLARRFAQAFAADDFGGVVALLTDDAWLAMPPAPHEYHGPAAISEFLRVSADWRAGRRFRLVPFRANTQPRSAATSASRTDRQHYPPASSSSPRPTGGSAPSPASTTPTSHGDSGSTTHGWTHRQASGLVMSEALPVTCTRSSSAVTSTSRRLGRPISAPCRMVMRAGRSTRCSARR